MNAISLMKIIPVILKGKAIVITVEKKKVIADCGKFTNKTVRQIAEGLLESVKN